MCANRRAAHIRRVIAANPSSLLVKKHKPLTEPNNRVVCTICMLHSVANFRDSDLFESPRRFEAYHSIDVPEYHMATTKELLPRGHSVRFTSIY